MSKTYRIAPRLSAEDVRVVQERRRSSATRFSRRKPRSTARRLAIKEQQS
jgi:hypothetical protein